MPLSLMLDLKSKSMVDSDDLFVPIMESESFHINKLTLEIQLLSKHLKERW